MSLIEIGKPLLRLTREDGGTGPCRDTNLRFIAEPPSPVYSLSAGSFITVNLLDEDGNFLQIVSYTQTGSTFDVVVDSDTPIALNGTPVGDVKNWNPIGVNLEDPDGNPFTPVSASLTGNILTVVIEDETAIEVNNAPQGDIQNGTTIEVNLEDSVGSPVAPLSVVKVGNTLTIEVPTAPAPSGVLLQWPNPDQITSYRTGDVGWRAQNGWYNYTPPTNPAKIAQLDLTAGANTWWILKNPLTVNGVSSTVRFVDVDGTQVFDVTNNKNAVVIDKLTGLMWSRIPRTAGGANKLWNSAVDACLAYSITVNGILYDDWFLPSLAEHTLSPIQLNIPMITVTDPATSAIIIQGGSPTLEFIWTSTTRCGDGTRAYSISRNATNTDLRVDTKAGDLLGHFFVRDARNLIS